MFISKINALPSWFDFDYENYEYVEKDNEFRGVWVATVNNIDIPKQGTNNIANIENYKRLLSDIVANAKKWNMNTIIYQIRPLNDAFYYSNINPISRFLMNSEGQDPGWDPLEYMVDLCHSNGIELHAWLNPYRASLDVLPSTGDYQTQMNNYLNTLDNKNFAKQNPNLLVRGGQRILLNPAKEEVRQHIYDTIEEITRNYDVDAIHFDDYFYNSVLHSEDDNLYNEWKNMSTLNTLSKGDWRREQVNILVKGIHDLLKRLNNELGRYTQFGISPAGGWAPDISECSASAYGMVGGMKGLVSCYSYSSYHDLFADTKKWVEEEWLDYILPQNYGTIETSNNVPITKWWADLGKNYNVKVYIGLAAYQYVVGYGGAWETQYSNAGKLSMLTYEMDRQMMYAYSEGVDGFAFYNYQSMKMTSNIYHINFLNNLYKRWTKYAYNEFVKQPYPEYNFNIEYKRTNNTISITTLKNPTVYAYEVYMVKEGENFNYEVEYLIGRTFGVNNYSFKVPVINSNIYEVYVKTMFLNGSFNTNPKKTIIKPFINTPPSLTKLTYSVNSTFVLPNTAITIGGNITDIDNDDIVLNIRLAYDNFHIVRTLLTLTTAGDFSFQFNLPNVENFYYIIFEYTDGDIIYRRFSRLFISVRDYYITSNTLYIANMYYDFTASVLDILK